MPAGAESEAVQHHCPVPTHRRRYSRKDIASVLANVFRNSYRFGGALTEIMNSQAQERHLKDVPRKSQKASDGSSPTRLSFSLMSD
ncbi:hypothetical protein J6590_074307 [Homalodisca vitripennis]|nr:hypothetical protein J6590_074307 [Homalodisca vitripennis]